MLRRSIFFRIVLIVTLIAAYVVVKLLEVIFGRRVWIVLVILCAVIGLAIRLGQC